MNALKIDIIRSFETTTCIECGCDIALVAAFMRQRCKDGKTFYCPSGHGQVFRIGESEEDRLRKALEEMRSKAATAIFEARAEADRRKAAEAALEEQTKKRKRVEKRVHNGVCPDCNRHFTDLERHMHTKHAESPTGAEGGKP